MKKKDYFSLALCLLIGIAGLLVQGFYGGLLAGAGASLFLVIAVGNWMITKAAARIEKTIADRNFYTSKNYDND